VRQAKTPALFINRGDPRDRIWLILERMQMFLEFRKAEGPVDWSGIAEHVQVALLEINDLSPGRVEDERVSDIPFLWNSPIENFCPGRYFKELEWDETLKNAKRFTHTIAGNASTDGEQPGHQLMHERPAMLKLRVDRFLSLC
jgi:hypothetical protein